LFEGLTSSIAPTNCRPPNCRYTRTSATSVSSANGSTAVIAGGVHTWGDDPPVTPGSSITATSISMPYCTFASAKYSGGRRWFRSNARAVAQLLWNECQSRRSASGGRK
jgi:hypothetical protein